MLASPRMLPPRDHKGLSVIIRRAVGSLFVILPSTGIMLLNDKNEEGAPPAVINIPSSPCPAVGGVPNNASNNREGDDEREESGANDSHLLSTARTLRDAILAIHRSEQGCVPRSFLLTSLPGVGKTHAVRTIIARFILAIVELVSARGSKLLSSGLEGDACTMLGLYHSTARFCYIMFLDEAKSLLSSSSFAGMLGSLLSRCHSSSTRCHSRGWDQIVTVATTNSVDWIPSSLRCPGDVDREVCVCPPDAEERFEMLRSLLQPLPPAPPTKSPSWDQSTPKRNATWAKMILLP